MYVASDGGAFEGSPIRLIEYSSASQVLSAFRNHSIEAASLTLDEALLLAEDIEDTRIVLVQDVSAGADVLLSRPEAQSLMNLRGRRIGYEATALGAYLLSRALELGDLRPDEVVLVPIQADEHEKAYREGRVDAVVTFEPTRTRLLALGARELFSTRDVPNEVMDVIVTRGEVLAKDPAGVDSLVRGWFYGVEALSTNLDSTLRQTGQRLGLTAEQARASYRLIELGSLDANRRWLLTDPPALRAVEQRIGDRMFSRKLLRRPIDGRSLVDAAPVRRFAATRSPA